MRKNIFQAFLALSFLIMILSAARPAKDCDCKEKDKIIKEKDKEILQLVKFLDRFAKDHETAFEARKSSTYTVYNMPKDTCMTDGMREHILETDSLLKHMTERIDFTGEEVNQWYKANKLFKN